MRVIKKLDNDIEFIPADIETSCKFRSTTTPQHFTLQLSAELIAHLDAVACGEEIDGGVWEQLRDMGLIEEVDGTERSALTEAGVHVWKLLEIAGLVTG